MGQYCELVELELSYSWFSGGSTPKMKKNVKEIWKMIPLAIMWPVWKLRNDCIFNEAQPTLNDLADLVKIRVAMWAVFSLKEFKYSVHDVLYNLKQVCYCV